MAKIFPAGGTPCITEELPNPERVFKTFFVIYTLAMGVVLRVKRKFFSSPFRILGERKRSSDEGPRKG